LKVPFLQEWSDIFHADGYTDVNREQLTISVNVESIIGKASLITLKDTLSIPDALLGGNEFTTLWISYDDTE
jgi:hypothetical protein